MSSHTDNIKAGRRCHATKHNEQRCQARPIRGGRFCFWHDPSKGEERRKAGRLGGSRGRARTLPVDTPEFRLNSASKVANLLSRTVNQTLRGEIDPKVANAVGYLSGVILKAYEQGELEERIREIENRLRMGGA